MILIPIFHLFSLFIILKYQLHGDENVLAYVMKFNSDDGYEKINKQIRHKDFYYTGIPCSVCRGEIVDDFIPVVNCEHLYHINCTPEVRCIVCEKSFIDKYLFFWKSKRIERYQETPEDYSTLSSTIIDRLTLLRTHIEGDRAEFHRRCYTDVDLKPKNEDEKKMYSVDF